MISTLRDIKTLLYTRREACNIPHANKDIITLQMFGRTAPYKPELRSSICHMLVSPLDFNPNYRKLRST